MHTWVKRFPPLSFLLALGFFVVGANVGSGHEEQTTPGPTAQGIVFEDLDGDGVRSPEEPGIAGIRVSNGQDIVETNAQGQYKISIDNDTIIFVLKPRNWQTPVNGKNLPRFFYVHKPGGSPDEHFVYRGVDPTGPLPQSVDFPLTKVEEPDEFTVIMMGDPQPYNRREVRFYANDVLAELVDTTAAFGISLGDIVGDDLTLFEPVNAVQALVGVPWYNVIGNHDINFRSVTDEYSDETYERVYGPPNYAFQYGPVHFVVLDNVVWSIAPEEENSRGRRRGGYRAALNKGQLQFVRNYVSKVPKEDRIVVCVHIPLPEFSMDQDYREHRTDGCRELMEILSSHPHTMSFSAHTHYNHHQFVGAEQGYDEPGGHEHHHHNVATGSGSWYGGPKDDRGFPITTMADGAPNGYIKATFSGNQYKLRYKAAGLPEGHQMVIHTPEVIDSSSESPCEVVANVFNGNKHTRVKMRVRGQGDWIAMDQTMRRDPTFTDFHQRDAADERGSRGPITAPKVTAHLWAAHLAQDIPAGCYVLEVQSTDMFGNVDRGIRIIEVE